MRLTELAVENFRCHKAARIELAGGPVALVGENGGGKTSLLEAAYLLATRKSFRTAQLGRLVRQGAPAGAARGVWSAPKQRARAREARLAARGAVFLYDDRPLQKGELPEFIPVVAFCREFLLVLTGPPEARRRYLDRGLAAAEPGYVRLLAELRRGLRHKQAALAGRPLSELRAVNQALCVTAFKVQRARARFVERLNAALPLLAEELRAADASLEVPLALAYRPSPGVLPDILAGETHAHRLAWESKLGDERTRGMSLVGPQRDDLALLWETRPVTQASGGQQRLALYLLSRAVVEVLARRYGAEPLFLYDDADAELDEKRLAAVLGSLSGAPGQLLITAKRRAVADLLPRGRTVYSVAPGAVERME